MSTEQPISAYGQLADRFATITQSLVDARDLSASFDVLLQESLDTVSGAEAAGITLMRNGEFTTPAATGPLALKVDRIQYELRSGPCVDVVREGPFYRTGDLGEDQRWPEFGARAARELGVHSMLSYRLFLDDDQALAGLNFYSTKPDAFDDGTVQTGMLLATQAAMAIVAASRHEKVENLEAALATNREIGMGIGVLMNRHKITDDQAFALLRMASQHTHRKLRDIARDVVTTGQLDVPVG